MSGLSPEILLRAYAVGLFPMAERHDDATLYWIDPEKRGILPLDKFHIPRRLRRRVRSGEFDIRCDTAFEDAESTPDCLDGIDNDGDGRADWAGIDLNADGLFTLLGEYPPDPGCLSATQNSEANKPQCADGLDNDSDGDADYSGIDLNGDGLFNGEGEMKPDDACSAGAASEIEGMRRRDESDPTQCHDGIDNDSDGKTDYQPQTLPDGSPNADAHLGDPDCESIFDNTEQTTAAGDDDAE